jgi:excisionase family DNA binding protein
MAVKLTTPVAAPARRAMSIAHACATLDVARSTLYRLLDNQQLESIWIGRKRLILSASIERLLRAGHQVQIAPARLTTRNNA